MNCIRAQARKLLDEAAAAGDASGLADVSRRFFHTRAGYEATELLGTIRWSMASRWPPRLVFGDCANRPRPPSGFEPLLSVKLAVCWLRAGMVSEAADILARFEHAIPAPW